MSFFFNIAVCTKAGKCITQSKKYILFEMDLGTVDFRESLWEHSVNSILTAE